MNAPENELFTPVQRYVNYLLTLTIYCSMNVYTVVPVAPFEPKSIITKSIECLQELEHGDFGFEVYYFIDTFPGD
ncbi:MAG TPA: hypothetical protein VEG44_08285, partial [Candidatus Acidoferrales bacterium]|nr:hypothetical protein [Candidatus Acidoferrales bacterium]